MSGRNKQVGRSDRAPTRGASRISTKLLCSVSLSALTLFALPSLAQAQDQDRYWDGNSTSPGSGGSGEWSTGNLNWSPNDTGSSGPYSTPWINGLLDNAIFAGVIGGDVALTTPVTVHNITFNTDDYALTGNTLTLAGATPTITTATGVSTTINSAIAGSAGLTKAGAGALVLGGANSFTGGVNVDAGTLTLNGASTFVGDVVVASGATLGVANDGALGAAANRILTTAGAALTLNSALGASRIVSLGGGGQTTVSGAGAAATRYTGTGGLTAFRTSLTNNANDYTGKTIVQIAAEVVNFSSVGNLGQASALGAASDPTLGTISVQRVFGSTGTFAYTGAGADTNRNWDLSAFNGHMVLSNSGSGTLTLRGDIALSSTNNTAIVFSADSADLSLLGQMGQPSGNLQRVSFSGSSNARTITLGDANSFNAPVTIGAVTVKAGTLADGGSNSSLGAGTSVALNNGSVLSYTGGVASSNRTWMFDGATTVSNDGTGGLSLSGAASFSAGGVGTDTLTLGGGYGGANTFSGAISGSGNLASSGTGTWVLTGANTRTGTITVDSGTLRAGSASAFGTTTAVAVNGGTLDLNGFNLVATRLAGTGGTVALGSGSLTVNSASGTASFAGGITGTGGSLTKLGAGTLTLTGSNSYTGATSIGGGTLALDFTAAGAPASNIISNASTLNMAGGTLRVTGSTGQTQSFAATNITAASNTIAGAGAVTLNLGAINRSAGLVNFVLPTTGNIITTPSTVLGGWATVTSGTTSDYAQVDASGNIVARTTYANKDNAGDWATGDVVSDEGGAANTPYGGTVVSNVQLGGLKYTAATNSTVNIGSTLGVDGTIIVSASVGNAVQTITGGQLTGPAGGGALGILQNSTGAGPLTIASTIVDARFSVTGLTKAGVGRVVLSGLNTYTGGTTVSGGMLSVNSIANGGQASAIGASTNASSNLAIEGATLQYTGTSTSSDRGFTLATNGAVTAGTIDVTQAGTNLQFSGVVAGTDNAGLTKTGLGTLTLSNAGNTYAGVTTVNRGSLAVSTLANGGANSSIGAASSDASNLVLQGGGELEYIGGTASSNRGFTLGAGGGAIDVAQNTTTLTLSGLATGAGALTKNGAGTLVLSGTNDYTGTTVSAGILRAGSTSAFGAGPMTVNTGATLDLAGFSSAVGRLDGTGNVLLGSATLTVRGSGSFAGAIAGTGGVTIGTFLQGINQTFSGCGNSYQGPTTIQSGNTLTVDCLRDGTQASGIGASTSASTNLVFVNGALNYTGGTVTTDRGFSMSGGAGGAIGVQNALTTLTFSGQATGAGGSFTKSGAGTLVLSGNNTYGGGTNVSAGILRAGSTSAFGTGPMTVSAGATLDLANLSNTVAALAGSGNVTLGSATLTLSSGADGSGTNQNFSGAISGTGGLVKNGSGTQTQTLSGASSYTGPTVVNGGILAVTNLVNGASNSSIGASGAGASNLVLNGGTLRYTGASSSTDRLFTLGASATSKIEASGAGAIVFTNTGAIAYSAPDTSQTIRLGGSSIANNSLAAQITNNGAGVTSFTKEDASTWILTNSGSTYTGVTTISGGVLGVDKLVNGGFASSIGASTNIAANLVIGSGSTLRYTGAGDTTDRLFTLDQGVTLIESSGTGAIAFTNTGAMGFQGSGTRTFVLGGVNTGANIMGVSITDGAGGATTLAKSDGGNWYLTGDSTYSGPTNINAGTLFIGNGGTTGSITSSVVNVTGFGALGFNRSDAVTYAGVIQGAGGLTQAGAGTTILTGANTYAGGTTISAGTLQLGSGGATGSIVGNVANNGTLAFNRGNAYTFGGAITGAGTIAQIGSGTTTLTAANTASATTISAGTLQINGTLETATVAMTGASALTVNGTMGAAAGGTAIFTGDAGASTINVATGATLRAAGDLGGGGDVVNVTGTLTTGVGTLSVGDGNDTLVYGAGALSGSVSGGAGTDALQVNNSNIRVMNGADFTGFETLTKTLAGTLVLAGDHSYADGVTITTGEVQVGNGAASGTLVGDVANSGSLRFFRTGASTYAGVISGTGAVRQTGAGTMILTGDNSYTGATNVTAGTLLVNGDQSGATGLTSVESGATLGGWGVIGGDVILADNATLAAGSSGVGALTINGDLALADASVLAFEFGEANVPGGPLNDLVNVGGDLTLDGTVHVTQPTGGAFGPGVYRMFNYAGTLTDNGLTVGSLPSGAAFVQTVVANQVNLVNTAGLTLNFWDGSAGPRNDGLIQGGAGVWRVGGGLNAWTEVNGAVNADYAQDSFAIFQGTGGAVTIDNGGGDVLAAGMQFTADGYTIAGGPLTLTGAQAFVRTGDGSAGDAGITTTINASLTGSAQLVKDMGGTLVLTGANSYTGGTAINGGGLRISSDANLGDLTGGLSFNGGTLNTTATFSSGRAVNLAGTGTFSTNPATLLTLSGVISGTGALTKEGAGELVLTGANTYTGGTTINSGTLRIGNGGTTGSIVGDVASTGSLRFNRSDAVTFAGVYSGVGTLYKEGAGTLILTGNNTATGATRIAGGTLQIGAGGATGSISDGTDIFITGATSALVFNRSDTWTYGGDIAIVGAASMTQAGTGTTILTGTKSGTGPINVNAGTLLMNGDASASSGLTSVASGATLGGAGIIGGSVAVADGGALAAGSNGVGTLTINGNLMLAGSSQLAYEFGQSNIVGGPLNDLVDVGGDLTLDGEIDVTVSPGGSFGPGLYRVISYGGALNDQGLAAGTMPPGAVVAVQTSVAGQVNLVNAAGGAFNFWDGANPANESNNLVDGGSGTWQNSAGNNDWTTTTGLVSGPYSDGGFAIFAAMAGQVDIDNSLGAVTASGLQFASDGYTITGQDLMLVGPQSTIRVGDGTAVGAGFTATIDAALIGNTQVVKADLGTLVLTGTNSYSGGTRIDAGTLRISSDANLGDAAGNLSFGGGTLNTTADITSSRAVDLIATGTFLTDGGAALTLNGAITGAGGFTKAGAGDLILAGANSYTGAVDVAAGSLFVNGDQSAATGLVSVASGATLGGSGVIGGNVAIADGAVLAAGANGVGTLTINGGLTLGATSLLDFEFGEANTAGGGLNDLVDVGGDLTLDGAINVSVPTGGGFGPGIYRVFNYGGTLTDNGLALGALPGGSAVSVQTAVEGQINLVNTAGLTLSFWDGNAGPKNNGMINGGAGVWRVGGGSSNWTDENGALNADYAQDSFVIFSAAPGTVTVDNSGGDVLASGMQFASDGYVIAGGPLTLTGAQATIQVGDSSAAGANYTATVAAELAGTAGLLKTDAGTLVLTGANSYTGDTQINAGTLQLGNGGAGGSIVGDVVNSGMLAFNRSDSHQFDGVISGSGAVAQIGAGTTILAADNGYAGGTTISAGTLQVGNGGTAGSIGTGDVLNNGALVFDRSNDLSFGGTIAGAGALTKLGAGTLTLIADNSYGGLTTVSAGTLQIGDGGATGAITGDVLNNGTLTFNRTGPLAYAGAITGAGPVNLLGGATYSFTGESVYSGDTNITASELRLANGGSITTTGATVISGVDGTVTVNGIGSSLTTNTLRVSIGNDDNTLDIENGGVVRVTSTSATQIGSGTGSSTGTGIVNVAGAGSLFDVAGALALGAPVPTVSAILNVTDGGTVLSDAGSIGYAFTGVNAPPVSVTVSGAGSNWTMANALNVQGGSMSVLDGGVISAGSAQIGFAATDILVSGAGSTLAVTGDVTIGGAAPVSTVTLANGGRMSVGGQLTLANAASSQTVLNIGGVEGQAATGVLDASTLMFGAGDGRLNFNHTDTDYVFATAMTGAGTINQIVGVTSLTGDSSGFTGTTTVSGGTLRVNGTLGDAASAVNVATGGVLGGIGTIGGDVVLSDGATLAAGSGGVGALTINGDLAFGDTSVLAFEFGEANVPGGPLNDLVNVGGDLMLDGTINVAQPAGGSFGPGVYRVINYTGLLTDNGLTVGGLPSGAAFVQTAVANQVNLVNTAGLTLNFWDGPAGPKNDGVIQGGAGAWVLGGGANDWTEVNGLVNADYAQDSFAIFQGAGGIVTIDNSGGNVLAAGMQFTADGYTIAGGPLTLTGTQAFVRVGDGSAGDAGITTTIDAALTGSAQLVKDMGGSLVLTGANSYTGGTAINGGTLQIGNGGTTGSITGDVVNNAALVTNRSDVLVLDGAVSGSGSLTQAGGGLLTLTADNSYTGGTTIAAGTLQLGNGGATGSIVGDVLNDGNLAFARLDTLTFAGTISGSGSVTQQSGGTTILTGANGYAGETRIAMGALLINGDQSAATGVTNVLGDATLGGIGTIGGDVVVADGATLAPGAGGAGALTINGSLSLASAAVLNVDFGAANAVGSPLNDVVNIGGDLTLDGTLNVAVTPGGAFDIGLYRIASYGGTLTDNGLALGALPAGADAFVQTSVANQVNLINVGGATLNFWDGAAGPRFNGAINGGSGVWQNGTGNDNWADATGAVNAGYADGAFAIFTGAAGTVTIDNSLGAVTASDLQFASDGYTIGGDALTFTGPQSVIRVGDGTAAGADYTATISAELTGATQLVKTDAGTLVLTGANSYTGGTLIDAGTLRIASDANLGEAAGGLGINNGTLNTTADLSSGRAVDLAGAGSFLTDASTTLTLTGAVSGAGSLTKNGAGTLVLAGAGSHTGGTAVGAGTLLVNGDFGAATGATTVASGASLGGAGTIGGDVTLANGATLTPGADGAGTLTIGGDLSLASGSQLAFEFGQANALGGALNDLVNVGGDLTLDGTINVTVPTGGAFGAGIYRVFNYGGTLIDNGLTIGALPGGSSAAVQTSITGQVNLVNADGLALSFWDGAVGPKNNGVINGAAGVWQNNSGNDNWTDANGAVNAAYSDDAFAVFGGAGGAVTVDNSLGEVTAAGMQFAANGYTIAGDAVVLTGPQSTIRVGDGSTVGAGFTATINSVLAGDTQLVKTDAGVLILGGANTYTGGTLVNGGTVQISADANLGAASGDVTLDGGTLATSANLTSNRGINLAGAGTISTASGTTFTFDGLLSGSGMLTTAGAGTLLLTGDNSGFAGSTQVDGTLTVNGSLCGDVNVGVGGRLQGTGTVCSTVNAGTIATGNSIGTLTVAGDYTGNAGTLEVEAELGDDASPTDRLVVTGGTFGTTEVVVLNQGGLGAATVEGIKIVDVGGASDGVFTLNGDYVFEGEQAVIAGAYGYRLYKNGVATPSDGDWYLRSSLLEAPGQPNEPQAPLYQPGVPLYESYAETLQSLSRLPTLQERVGNRQWAGFSQSGIGMWSRVEGTRYRPEAAASTSGADLDLNDWSLQAGFDAALRDDTAGTLIAGINGRYGEADAQVRSRFGNGEIDASGFGLGATLTWYGGSGFYADAQAQLSWYRSELQSGVLGTLVDDNHGTGEAFSLEVGKRAPLGGGLSVTPQIQMAYSNVRFDQFVDPSDALVSSDEGESLRTRWGVSLDHQKAWDGRGGERRTHVYGLVNLSYEWLDGSVADVSGTSILRREDRLWGELGVGGSYSWNDGRVTLFSEVAAETAIDNFGDSTGLRANAGLRMKF